MREARLELSNIWAQTRNSERRSDTNESKNLWRYEHLLVAETIPVECVLPCLGFKDVVNGNVQACQQSLDSHLPIHCLDALVLVGFLQTELENGEGVRVARLR